MTGGERRRATAAAAWLAALAVYVLAFQGARPLWEPDEGRYAAVALEMLRSGDLIHPALHHELPHFTKPPLTYWLLAASLKLFGRHEWALRVPIALAFAATTLAVYGLAQRLTPRRPLLAALVYASSLLPAAAAHIVTTDTILALWETLAVLAFVAAWSAGGDARRRRWALAAMWALFGLAFLTKGPPGLLPLLAILPFAAWAGGWRGLGRVLWPPAVALLPVVGLWWFAVVAWQSPELLRYFLADEVAGRLARGDFDRHPQWYGALRVYAPVLLAGSLPWTWVALAAARRLRRLAEGELWRRRGDGDPWLVFLLAWFVVPLAIFCLARSRLELYVLPLFAPLALLVARHGRLRWPLPRWGRVALAAWLVAMVGLRLLAGAWPTHRDDRALAREIRRLHPAPIHELVFVDQRPRHGLAFYLDAEVERVDLAATAPRGSPGAPPQSVAQELAEREGVRLWVVPEGEREAMLAALRAAGGRRAPGRREFVLLARGARWEDGIELVPLRREAAAGEPGTARSEAAD